MRNIKVCSFVASYTHSCIVANNFISKEFTDAKVIYINENNEKEKLKNIVNKYFKKINEKILYLEWLNEEITNDYLNENIIKSIEKEKEDLTSYENEYNSLLENKPLNEDYTKIINDFLKLKNPNRQLLASLIDKIEVDEQKNVFIYFKINSKQISL